jgi:hypothetical protein
VRGQKATKCLAVDVFTSALPASIEDLPAEGFRFKRQIAARALHRRAFVEFALRAAARDHAHRLILPRYFGVAVGASAELHRDRADAEHIAAAR